MATNKTAALKHDIWTWAGVLLIVALGYLVSHWPAWIIHQSLVELLQVPLESGHGFSAILSIGWNACFMLTIFGVTLLAGSNRLAQRRILRNFRLQDQ